ncbi:hypothetical protein DFH27DRAFT_609329 [Peziza echinospora]|nr:hypothetical protein DFH27DRAFT_609329 [Peziza echinospora]
MKNSTSAIVQGMEEVGKQYASRCTNGICENGIWVKWIAVDVNTYGYGYTGTSAAHSTRPSSQLRRFHSSASSHGQPLPHRHKNRKPIEKSLSNSIPETNPGTSIARSHSEVATTPIYDDSQYAADDELSGVSLIYSQNITAEAIPSESNAQPQPGIETAHWNELESLQFRSTWERDIFNPNDNLDVDNGNNEDNYSQSHEVSGSANMQQNSDSNHEESNNSELLQHNLFPDYNLIPSDEEEEEEEPW